MTMPANGHDAIQVSRHGASMSVESGKVWSRSIFSLTTWTKGGRALRAPQHFLPRDHSKIQSRSAVSECVLSHALPGKSGIPNTLGTFQSSGRLGGRRPNSSNHSGLEIAVHKTIGIDRPNHICAFCTPFCHCGNSLRLLALSERGRGREGEGGEAKSGAERAGGGARGGERPGGGRGRGAARGPGAGRRGTSRAAGGGTGCGVMRRGTPAGLTSLFLTFVGGTHA